MSKKNTSTQDKKKQSRKYITHPKLIMFLVLLVALFLSSIGYSAYKDWDNAQTIRGLARDFPGFVNEVQSAVGAGVDVSTNCHSTQEKFAEGVKTCELALGYIGQAGVEPQATNALDRVDHFSVASGGGGKYGYGINYKGEDVCRLWFAAEDRLNFSCVTAVRDANIQLAIDEFSRITD